jgi:hypothetical protein
MKHDVWEWHSERGKSRDRDGELRVPNQFAILAETKFVTEQFFDDVHHSVAKRFRKTGASCILDASAFRRAAYAEAHRRSG